MPKAIEVDEVVEQVESVELVEDPAEDQISSNDFAPKLTDPAEPIEELIVDQAEADQAFQKQISSASRRGSQRANPKRFSGSSQGNRSD